MDHGSFTGIRIGVSTAKALAVVNNIPIVGVSSLEALSYNVKKEHGTICSLIDAKNHQVYCGIFDTSYKLIHKYLADDINSIMDIVNQYADISFVGNGASNYLNINVYENLFTATQIGILGYNKFLKGEQKNSDTILPLYLRVSQAERIKNLNENKRNDI